MNYALTDKMRCLSIIRKAGEQCWGGAPSSSRMVSRQLIGSYRPTLVSVAAGVSSAEPTRPYFPSVSPREVGAHEILARFDKEGHFASGKAREDILHVICRFDKGSDSSVIPGMAKGPIISNIPMAKVAASDSVNVGSHIPLEATRSLIDELQLGCENSVGLTFAREARRQDDPLSKCVVQERCGMGSVELQPGSLESGADLVVCQGKKRNKEAGGLSLSLDPKRGKEKLLVDLGVLETSVADTFHMGLEGCTKSTRLRCVLKLGRAGKQNSSVRQAVNLGGFTFSFKAKEAGHTMPPTLP
ncbi:hypothetical protein CJ030_MR6G002443 [Morella rubra]|uniref:Uncharacterized protein n=1 Tax=Morella rubra TaxID=262757 RepID=A0A6A1V9G9_9ROSI|nr:hypothetical protein CJ030_MR6G002443 [Morella rubra]